MRALVLLNLDQFGWWYQKQSEGPHGLGRLMCDHNTKSQQTPILLHRSYSNCKKTFMNLHISIDM
jgi:hypothetical protein